jgi:tight adherence protein C
MAALTSPLLLSVLAFATVMLLALGLLPGMFAKRAVSRRLAGESGAVAAAPEARASLRRDHDTTFWAELVRKVEKLGVSLEEDKKKSSSVREQLNAAGFTHPDAPKLYTLARIIFTLTLPALYMGLNSLSPEPPSFSDLYLKASGAAFLGWMLPKIYVGMKVKERGTMLFNGFPDALDLLLVCVEAGLGVDAAFGRVGGEIAQSQPLLGEQFAMLTLQLRAGRSRADALRAMADRCHIEEIRSFTTLLIQSEALGSSISQTLRIYAAEMRERRRMRAEEKAHKLPVLLSIPLVCFMLPTIIGVFMIPAAISFIRQMAPVMGG